MKRYILLVALVCGIISVCDSQIKVVKPNQFVEDVGSVGVQNAIKKAHQMTDLEFVPVDTIRANKSMTYRPNRTYKGLVYSSVQETSTFVGLDVSLHSFMTAMHNPRSVVYTENLRDKKYHSNRTASYYGTVCSAFVSHALGFTAYETTYDIPELESMTLVADQSAKGIQLADVLWQKGHVALITGIRRNKNTGEVVWIEISEAWLTGCRRRVVNGETEFNKMLKKGEWKIYRYNNFENNGYQPWTDFVAVEGETRTPFTYNDAICPNKGDQSCYAIGETVVLNMAEGYQQLEIYKDSKLYKRIDLGNKVDVALSNLPYGDYKARVTKKQQVSDFAYWKVIDVHVNNNEGKDIVTFSSANATPVYLEFCTKAGSRPTWAWYILTEEDLQNGYVKLSKLPIARRLKKKKEDMYTKMHFECDWGRVVNAPTFWNKSKMN